KRHRDRAASRGCRRPARQGPRRRLLEQSDLARRDGGQLLPRLQRAAELRSVERGAEAGCAINLKLKSQKSEVRSQKLRNRRRHEAAMLNRILVVLLVSALAPVARAQTIVVQGPGVLTGDASMPPRDPNAPRKTGTAVLRGRVVA